MSRGHIKRLIIALGVTTLALGFVGILPGRAATLKVTPDAPQPGDVLTVTVYPAGGEKLTAVGMAAFDTDNLKFYQLPNGTARAFVGLPFDRKGGTYTLRARVQLSRNGTLAEQVLAAPLRARNRNFPTQYITMRASTAGTMSRTGALRQEKLFVQSKMKNSHAGPLWEGRWLLPASGLTSSAYGRRRYVNGRWWGQHNGTDFKAPNGARVVATNSGQVVLSQYLPTLRGNCIVIDHGCNVYSLYYHLSERLASVGQRVAKGQLIGKVGGTGFATGPHLHWEIRIGWEPVDPVKVARSGLRF